MSGESNRTSAVSRSRRAVFVAAILAVGFVLGFAVPAVSQAGWVRFLYVPFCHQIPERSLEVGGSAMAVCSRCAGLYAGGAIGLLCATLFVVGRRHRLSKALLFVAIAPTAVDALLPWVGLPSLSNLPRFGLAFPAGFVAALFLAVGIADLFTRERSSSPPGPLDARESLEVVDG